MKFDFTEFHKLGSKFFDDGSKTIKDTREKIIHHEIIKMLTRTYSMFDYDGLPKTVSKRAFKLMLQTNGYVALAPNTGKDGEKGIYAFVGGLGGKPDPYYMPTILTVANPALDMFKMEDIGEDTIIIPNDPFYQGLLPVCRFYAEQLADNIISKRMASILLRAPNVFAVDNDNSKESVELFIKKLWEGDISEIVDKSFRTNVNTIPFGDMSHSSITDLIENNQYIKASWFNDLGLQSNYNMKREAINSSEAQLGDEALFPTIDSMFEIQSEAIEKANELFGLNITIKKNSSWNKKPLADCEQTTNQLDKEEDDGAFEGNTETT